MEAVQNIENIEKIALVIKNDSPSIVNIIDSKIEYLLIFNNKANIYLIGSKIKKIICADKIRYLHCYNSEVDVIPKIKCFKYGYYISETQKYIPNLDNE